MSESRSHRSFVSYIDKNREYYQAQGYEQPYRWAHYDDVPFCELSKPLSQCRVGIVTTADKKTHETSRSSKLSAVPNSDSHNLVANTAWDRDATHLRDPETYLPVARIAECAQRHRIGSVSPRFFGVPTDYSRRRTSEEDAPQIEAWLREDAVDVVLLVAI